MKLSKLIPILALTIGSGLASGCLDREVYLKPGQVAEVADPVNVRVWIKNAATGKREKRLLRAQSGYGIGRRKVP